MSWQSQPEILIATACALGAGIFITPTHFRFGCIGALVIILGPATTLCCSFLRARTTTCRRPLSTPGLRARDEPSLPTRPTRRIWLRSVPPQAALGFGFAPIRAWFNRAVKLVNGNAAAASIFVGAIALSLRLLLTHLLPLPKPAVHDEFSYLLAADTFSHGRLTNPTHPMWIHFETFHELSRPTYASMYPPGQGLVLALGQIFHAPWFALWIGMAVLCGLITWALWVWLEPPWAIAGGLLAALHLTGSYWTDTYWGGTVAAIGGALVVGALARLLRRASPGPALAYGLGLAILANTRPYEGFVLGAWSAVFLLVHLVPLVRGGRQNLSDLVHSIALPLAFVLLPAVIWMGYYNYRVTGDPLQTPYSLGDKQYSSWSPFLWSNHPRPQPTFDHEIFRAFSLQFANPVNQFLRQHILFTHLINLIELYLFFLACRSCLSYSSAPHD